MERPSKQEYYMNIAKEVARRSNCLSAHLGAIIVKDDQIISTGYNGAPRKTKDCYEYGFCLRRKLGIKSGQQYELCRSVHAEQNAIINAARAGVSLLGSKMYIYGERIHGVKEPQRIDAFPCFICRKMVINAGIKLLEIITKDGTTKEIPVQSWIDEWNEKDMIGDVKKYETNYKKEQ